jgi:hypothetical protein
VVSSAETARGTRVGVKLSNTGAILIEGGRRHCCPHACPLKSDKRLDKLCVTSLAQRTDMTTRMGGKDDKYTCALFVGYWGDGI